MKTEPNQSLQTISCSVTVAAEPLCVPPHEMSDLKRWAKQMKDNPQAMLVSFGFFEGDTPLHKGALYIRPSKGVSVYGEHKHFVLPKSSIEIQLFSGLVIEHAYESPACPVTIKYFGIEPGVSPEEPYRQIQHLKAAVRMGIHDSEDWESLQLLEYTLGFKCRLVT